MNSKEKMLRSVEELRLRIEAGDVAYLAAFGLHADNPRTAFGFALTADEAEVSGQDIEVSMSMLARAIFKGEIPPSGDTMMVDRNADGKTH